MFSGEFSLYRDDPTLPTIGKLTVKNLTTEMSTNIPRQLLGASACSYHVTNVRYRPTEKLVIGLVSSAGGQPVGIRVFPQHKLYNRLAKARRMHPHHTFMMHDANAIAWVCPAERKLDLDLVADRQRLSQILEAKCNIRLKHFDLAHFVPEHSYTARLVVDSSNGEETYYLKIYYDDVGARTADIMRQLARQTSGGLIAVPTSTMYLAEHRMLLQSALPRDPSKALSATRAAQALAGFHALTADAATKLDDPVNDNLDRTISLVESVLPSYAELVTQVVAKIRMLLADTTPGNDCLLHGDAHLGNLFSLDSGLTGIIDLDQVAIGPPEHDLASFFAFKLWIAIREQQSVSRVLNSFPAFIATYNQAARTPVALRRSLALLATKMVTERIARGISRGKVSTDGEVAQFLEIATWCLSVAGRSDA